MAHNDTGRVWSWVFSVTTNISDGPVLHHFPTEINTPYIETYARYVQTQVDLFGFFYRQLHDQWQAIQCHTFKADNRISTILKLQIDAGFWSQNAFKCSDKIILNTAQAQLCADIRLHFCLGDLIWFCTPAKLPRSWLGRLRCRKSCIMRFDPENYEHKEAINVSRHWFTWNLNRGKLTASHRPRSFRAPPPFRTLFGL